ncbi:MAG: peptide chain release factor N(5)-glutamine methyltransferase [Clostridia bacterium]|jgi:release factor-specific protein-(glutamine-N5) methyltransferase
MSKKNCCDIGGQAVLEGVMMRGKSVMATAVRDPYGNIQVESQRFVPFKERSWAFKVPILRGILNFVVSMTSGMKTLMRSTEVYGDDIDSGEPSRFEKWAAKKLKTDVMHIAMGIGLLLGVLFAVGLFIFLPTYATKWVFSGIDLSSYSPFLQSFFPNITSGGIKILVFVTYILLISLMKDIKRLFRYHGAEHKTISAYEHGLELTVENVRTMKTAHDRCGSTFIVFIMVFSIMVLSVLPWFENAFYNFLIRLACLPFIAGICYEFLKIFAKFDNLFTKIFKAPGMLLQKLTVKEPDDRMIEVAIAAFNSVLSLEADPSKETTTFNIFTSIVKSKKKLAEIISNKKKGSYEDKEREAEIILLNVLGLDKHSELSINMKVPSEKQELAEEIARKRQSGMPLQYAIGKTNFYGFDFIVDKRGLIPRFDTEILVEAALQEIKKKGDNVSVLDLCTGSGAVGITIKKLSGVKLTLSDISEEALSLAKENVNLHGVEANLVKSDLFSELKEKFDIIVVNPPYVPSEEIKDLDEEVKSYEPLLALDGGKEGLDKYKQIAEDYSKYLNEEGTIILEAGIGQMEDLVEMFPGEKQIIEDYNNPKIPRVLIVRNTNTQKR